MKTIILILTILLTVNLVFPAQASICRNYDDNLICILKIKRSAKYHWQYRASVSINGVVQPLEVYDCHQQIKIQKNGKIIPFSHQDASKLICQTLSK